MPPSSTWTIEEIVMPGGEINYEVALGNRRQRSYSVLESAIKHVKKAYLPGQKVIRIEPDGYRTTITQQFLTLTKSRQTW